MKALPNLKTTIEKLINEQQNSAMIGTILDEDLNVYDIQISLKPSDNFHDFAMEDGVLLAKNPQMDIDVKRMIEDKIINLSKVAQIIFPENGNPSAKLNNKLHENQRRKMTEKDWLKISQVIQMYIPNKQ